MHQSQNGYGKKGMHYEKLHANSSQQYSIAIRDLAFDFQTNLHLLESNQDVA